MSYKLVLVRHGESEWNKANLFTGWTDVDLSENGVEEAKRGGQLLKEEGFEFDVCYTSYLKRAIHTANNVLCELDQEYIPVIRAWQLNEKHYGVLQGLNKAETAAKYGDDQVKIWRRSFDVAPPALADDDERNPKNQKMFKTVPAEELPQEITDTVPETEEVQAVTELLPEGHRPGPQSRQDRPHRRARQLPAFSRHVP